jgi:DHA1 family tetracycline resistance protein-like MFS transporter
MLEGRYLDPAVERPYRENWPIFTTCVQVSFGAAGFTIYGLAPVGWMFLIGIPVMALWGLTAPSSQSIMSKHVSPSEQGQLQGANSSLQAIAGLLGPGLFTQAFSRSIASHGEGVYVPGLAYLIGAALILLSLATAWFATRPRRS